MRSRLHDNAAATARALLSTISVSELLGDRLSLVRKGEQPPGCLDNGHADLMRQEHRNSKVLEHVLGRAAQHEVAHARVAVATHDK